jgi:hypothetical protein
VCTIQERLVQYIHPASQNTGCEPPVDNGIHREPTALPIAGPNKPAVERCRGIDFRRLRWHAVTVLTLLAVPALVAGCRMGLPAAPAPNADTTQTSGPPPGDPPPDEPPPDEKEVPGTQPVTHSGGRPTLAIADAIAGESDRMLRLTASLSMASVAPVTVQYATEDGTATEGADYQAVHGTLTFAAETTQVANVEIPLRDDAVAEGQETFTIRLSEPHGAELVRSAATVTIIDDDARSLVVYPARLNVAEGAAGSFTVVLGSQPGAPVRVSVEDAEELTVVPNEVVFRASDWQVKRTVTVTAADDDDLLADAPVELQYTARGGGYDGVQAAVSVVIVENDAPTLAVAPTRVAESAGHLGFAVSLSLPGEDPVTVAYATGAAGDTAHAGDDYASANGTVQFAPGATASVTIRVPVHDDALDEATEQFTVTLSDPVHALLAGGGETATATATIDDDDPEPELRIADGSVSEGGGAAEFTVRLVQGSGRTVRVRYATADVTAVAGTDYVATTGELTFAPNSGLTRTISVAVTDDSLDEPDEQFEITLSSAAYATLDPLGRTATGTIRDDESAPRLTIADGSATEDDMVMALVVRLAPASGQIVHAGYRTADGTATAGTDYTAVSGTLTLPAGATTHTITVPVLSDEIVEGAESFTLTLHDPSNATLADAEATGTIADGASRETGIETPELSALQVTGGENMYPPFAADTLHYAVTCSNPATLRVTARAESTAATLTLLRDAPNADHSATGTLDVQISANHDHDIAIRLSDAGNAVTYVVHCLPEDFPTISILEKTSNVSEGLLFMTPRSSSVAASRYLAIVDNNGVPRFHQPSGDGRNFRPTSDGPVINGSQVRYSFHTSEAVTLLDGDLEKIRSVSPVAPLESADKHDHLITPEGNYLFMDYHLTSRDLCEAPATCPKEYRDSIIQEVAPDGEKKFEWNSWDHLKLADCSPGIDYAHLNSLQVIDGDIIASFRNCGQVLRIDRSSGTGAVKWQLGGTAPPRDAETTYLEIVGDDEGTNEFCNQHHATLTADDSVVLFDNGVGCRGTRKHEAIFSRVVEYDISSGTQAEYRRSYRLPTQYGATDVWGGATVLDSDRWLIAWNNSWLVAVPSAETIAVSEINPVDGTAHLHMHMSAGNSRATTYRVYREAEENVQIPLNLP